MYWRGDSASSSLQPQQSRRATAPPRHDQFTDFPFRNFRGGTGKLDITIVNYFN